MKSIIPIIIYHIAWMVQGAVLAIAGVTSRSWHFWVIISCMAAANLAVVHITLDKIVKRSNNEEA